MSRDLIYKPPVPLVVPDEADEVKKRSTDKLGLTVRGRDLGGEKVSDGRPAGPNGPEPAAAPQSAPGTSEPVEAKPRAFTAAYFTKDVEATAQVNQRTKPMQALRGGEGVSDLKKVVIPHGQVDAPDPEQLRQVGELMGITAGTGPEVTHLLQRQADWAKHKDVTVQMLRDRMAQLEVMVAARIAALVRMGRLPQQTLARSKSLSHALEMQGAAAEKTDDVVETSNALARDAADTATGMHKRLAKALGIKSKP